MAVFTDPNVAKLPAAKMVRDEVISTFPTQACRLSPKRQAIASLESQEDLPFEVYDRVVAEPTEASWRDAIAWARQHDCSHYLA